MSHVTIIDAHGKAALLLALLLGRGDAVTSVCRNPYQHRGRHANRRDTNVVEEKFPEVHRGSDAVVWSGGNPQRT